MTRLLRRDTAVLVWAAAGIIFLFGEAAWRLGARGTAAIRDGLTTFEWLALAVLMIVFVYGEGVRALQRRWVPYVLTRMDRLRAERRTAYRVAAPLYAMSLIGPPRAAAVRAWAGVAAIIAAVMIVRRFPEPWRGIVDLAVAAALVWGAIALLIGAARLVRAGAGAN